MIFFSSKKGFSTLNIWREVTGTLGNVFDPLYHHVNHMNLNCLGEAFKKNRPFKPFLRSLEQDNQDGWSNYA